MTMRGKGEEGLEGMMWEVSCWEDGEEATAMPGSCDEEFESLAEPEAIAEEGGVGLHEAAALKGCLGVALR
jgi:hypothetical protein